MGLMVVNWIAQINVCSDDLPFQRLKYKITDSLKKLLEKQDEEIVENEGAFTCDHYQLTFYVLFIVFLTSFQKIWNQEW